MVTSAQVRAGIALLHACGTASAALYLCSLGVGLNVALRVLTRPRLRRT